MGFSQRRRALEAQFNLGPPATSSTVLGPGASTATEKREVMTCLEADGNLLTFSSWNLKDSTQTQVEKRISSSSCIEAPALAIHGKEMLRGSRENVSQGARVWDGVRMVFGWCRMV